MTDNDHEIIDIDELLKEISDNDLCLQSDDEEELNNTEFTENELRDLCGIDCFVDLRRRNLCYSYEKGIRQYFARKGYEFQPKIHYKVVEKKVKKHFHEFYIKYCLSWERKSEKHKLRRLRNNKRNAITYLKMKRDYSYNLSLNETIYIAPDGNVNNDINDDNDVTNDSQISSQTVIRKVQPMQQITQVQIHENKDDKSAQKDCSQDKNTVVSTHEENADELNNYEEQPIVQIIQVQVHENDDNNSEQKSCSQDEDIVVSTYEENTDALNNFMHHVGSKNFAVCRPFRYAETNDTQELTYSEFNDGIQHFTVIRSQPITSTQQPE